MQKTRLKTKILSLLLCFMMVFTAIPTTAFAATDVSSSDVSTLADESTNIAITIMDVRFYDDDGNYCSNGNMTYTEDGDDTALFSYIAPGVVIPDTVPEAEVTKSAWNNCNEYQYKWGEKSYIKLTILNTLSVKSMEWDKDNKNVLNFTLEAEDGATKDYKLTLKQPKLEEGVTMASLVEKVKNYEYEISMADSYSDVKAYFENLDLGLPEGMGLKLRTSESNFRHTASAGTISKPNGSDSTISLNVGIVCRDLASGKTSSYYVQGNSSVKVNVKDKALVYSEADKVNVTVAAVGSGTVTSEFVGMQAKYQSDASYKWLSVYTLKATPDKDYHTGVWVQTGGSEKDNLSGSGKILDTITVSAVGNVQMTAYFVKNEAPVIKDTAPKEIKTTVRNSVECRVTNYFEDYIKTTVDGKTYSKSDKVTYTATFDGKEADSSIFNGFDFNYVSGEAGEHTLKVTATDSCGASTTLTIPVIVEATTPSEYKMNMTATYKGEDISFGEDGLNATITYYGGEYGEYELAELDKYYDAGNIYYIRIKNWKDIAEKYNFSSLTIGDVIISASELPTSWTNYTLNGSSGALRVRYLSGSGDLRVLINNNAYSSPMELKEDLNIEFVFDQPAPDYTPTITVSGEGGTINTNGITFLKNTDGASLWRLKTTPENGYALDYIQLGDDESTRVYSNDKKTVTFKVNKADCQYTAYFRKLKSVEFTGKQNIGTWGKYNTNSRVFGYKGTINFESFDSLCCSADRTFDTEKNTLLYSEQVMFNAELNIGYVAKGTTVKGALYNGEDTTGTVLDEGEGTLDKDVTEGTYGVDFCFQLPEDITHVTAVLTLNEGKEDEFTVRRTFALADTGVKFREPVESDYVSVAVRITDYLAPTMVTKLKYSGGFSYLLGAYEEALKAEPKYKSIVIDNAGGFMNTIYLSTAEPEIKGTVYTEKNHKPGAWSWAQYYVNGFYCDLGVGSWDMYGDEIMVWGGLVSGGYAEPHTPAISNAADIWGTAVLRQYYTDEELVAAGVGKTHNTAAQLAELYPEHADEILNRQAVPKEVTPIFDEVVKKIEAIGTVTLASKNAISEARDAYNSLPATYFTSNGYLKGIFKIYEPYATAYKTLEAAEETLASLAEPDEAVEIMIDAIGTVTLDSGEAILKARQAYDALSDKWKMAVNNYETLEKAEEEYAKLQAENRNALESFENVYSITGNYLETLGKNNTITVNSIGGEWMVLGLVRSSQELDEGYFDEYLKEVVSFVKANIDENERLSSSKATENARLILALTALGYDVTDVAGHNLLEGLDEMSYVTKQGINGAIWTLIALDSHDYQPAGDVTCEKLVETILNAQLKDGGWALIGETSDSDITAMALQALAPYYSKNADVKAAVDKAVETLSKMQNADGSFSANDGNGGTLSTSESTAQVIVALTALGIDPNTDVRFVKYGNSAVDALRTFYVQGGGFKHTTDGELDGMATEQGYYALAAYDRFASQKTSLYNMSDVEITKQLEPAGKDDSENGGNTGDIETPNKPGNNESDNAGNNSNTGNGADDKTDAPTTGDQTPIMPYAGIILLALAGVACTACKRREN